MRDLMFMIALAAVLAVLISAGTRFLVDLNLILEGQPVPEWRIVTAALVGVVAFKALTVTWRRV